MSYSSRTIEPNRYDSAFRVVGYQEYGNALERFDQLLEAVSPEELQVIEQIVQEKGKYAVYTNLSRRVEGQPSLLSEAPSQDGDDFRRHGLAWMMALARVELGAIAAGFTDEGRPFELSRPSRYESPAFLEILADGARTHYWALRNDPVVSQPKALTSAEPVAIAYVRRVSVALSMNEALDGYANSSMSPEQKSALYEQQRDLKEFMQTMLYKVLKLHSSLVVSSNTTKEMVDARVDYSKLDGYSSLPSCARRRFDEVIRKSLPEGPATTMSLSPTAQ